MVDFLRDGEAEIDEKPDSEGAFLEIFELFDEKLENPDELMFLKDLIC